MSIAIAKAVLQLALAACVVATSAGTMGIISWFLWRGRGR